MELIGYYDSTFVRRVAVTLHWYGMPFAHRPLATGPDAAEIRTKNPLGRIPALVLDDGEVLIDSACIIDWLDERAGERALIPPAGVARRRVLRLTALAHGAAEKYVAAFYELNKRPKTHVWQPWLEAAAEAQVPWLTGAAMTHADVATACAVLAMRDDMPHLAPAGRFPRLDAIVAAAVELLVFRVTKPGNADTVSHED
jgi:glutathione S-transferase